ncbi:chemotaxis protein methyltransferase WspC [Pseudoduganella lurida]|uniref:Chemotaxis protein methyltransferase WspC n=1 Tax=Pseudoduganella lurida TaxID=1036180 RepID=A0A562RMM9_9BURK|nr:protein-glutamate O-methyltransferase CheR [Pseudoduganella lurida]TWI70259.1 chemotaxis protein methyltransferase WspC [Pseudoduganella lurida]
MSTTTVSMLQQLRAATGLNLSPDTVERAVRERMAATGIADREQYLQAAGAAELEQLVERVVVPESWLFRDPQAFVVAAAYARRRLERGGRQLLRMLSVPCAGGEEPYTLAMALVDAGIPPAAFAIDAIDLSAVCVARAKEGLFGRNAFRNKDLAFRDRHFTQEDDGLYRIDPGLRRRVRVRQGNLLTSDIAAPGTYDVVFCRNLLIYFDAPTTAAAIGRLATLLSDDGVLLAGYAEVPSFMQNGFTALPYRQAFALRKATVPDEGPQFGLPVEGSEPAIERRQARRTVVQAVWPAAARASEKVAAAVTAPARPIRVAPAAVPPLPRAAAAPLAKAPASGQTLDEARRLADEGRPAEAAAICRTLVAREPDNADGWFLLGLLSEDTDADEAQAHLRRCIYLAPDHYDALCHLALLAGQRGDSGAAASLKARAARVWRRRQSNETEP